LDEKPRRPLTTKGREKPKQRSVYRFLSGVLTGTLWYDARQ